MMSKNKRIFIIGQSGAGKGVLAKAVAEKLGWQFIDADFSLTPSIGQPLSEIIGAPGVAIYTRCLSDILSYQCTKENIVVTTDDSIICDKKNRELLAKEFTVFLQVSTSVQLERISHNRPLLPVDDYRAFLDKLHQERDSLYAETDSYTLSSDDGDIDVHTLRIITAFGK